MDTNVLVDVLEDDPDWADWSVARMRELASIQRLVINPIIYAEVSLTFEKFEELDAVLDDLQLPLIQVPRPALFLAGRAFLRYRRRGGRKTNVLSDFFVGAHAAVEAHAVLTRDPHRYLSYFPTVRVVHPAGAA